MKNTPLLDTIDSPKALRNIDDKLLNQLADELRAELIDITSTTGGHLGAGLGVIELTIALHKVFNTPKDKLIWDVGHQSYPHKILTGRRNKMHSLRQKNGLSGFAKRKESIYDTFGAGHSSTSISAAIGMQKAAQLKKQQHKIIAVIGDGAMSAGMAFEAMNNAGAQNDDIIVVLNDNDMSIARPVGAMSNYLARLLSGKGYSSIKNMARQFVKTLPQEIAEKASKAEELYRGFLTGGTLFEEMGFQYIGPIDGHCFNSLMPVLRNVKKMKQTPILLHVITKKGKGYPPAEKAKDKFHGVRSFDVITGQQKTSNKKEPTYTNVFSETLIKIAQQDKNIVAITAAMPSGTGLDKFAQIFPNRCFDVGIAEQHAVTFAAGLAAEGMKPFVAIYSTFLQRAYDQIVHDVAVQKLPVRFAIDRAGLVGADGPTHAGSFDITYLATLPHFILMAPADRNEMHRMILTAAQINHAPCAVRYPRGIAHQNFAEEKNQEIDIGKSRIICEGERVAILNYGARLQEAKKAIDKLEKYDINPTLIDARFAKPLDIDLIKKIAKKHQILITIEEGASGGFATQVINQLAKNYLLSDNLKFIPMFLPDEFIDQANVDDMYQQARLDAEAIIDQICSALKVKNKTE